MENWEEIRKLEAIIYILLMIILVQLCINVYYISEQNATQDCIVIEKQK